jgi:hypothetical protein
MTIVITAGAEAVVGVAMVLREKRVSAWSSLGTLSGRLAAHPFSEPSPMHEHKYSLPHYPQKICFKTPSSFEMVYCTESYICHVFLDKI